MNNNNNKIEQLNELILIGEVISNQKSPYYVNVSNKGSINAIVVDVFHYSNYTGDDYNVDLVYDTSISYDKDMYTDGVIYSTFEQTMSELQNYLLLEEEI